MRRSGRRAQVLRPHALALALLFVSGGTALADRPGMTLYSGTRKTGDSQAFYEDVPDLRDTRFGAGRARSLTIARGCVARLYSLPGYRGIYIESPGDDNDLGNTRLGRDAAASLQLRCGGRRAWDGGGGERLGVTLFSGRHREGDSETFDRDVRDLARTRFGAGRARSLDVSPGCVARVFQLPGFRGRYQDFRAVDNNLGNTAVGENAASSLRVRCDGGALEPEVQDEHERPRLGVTLYSGRHRTGDSQTFDRDVPDLDRTPFGGNRASSLDVSPGCVAVLYELPFYRGRSQEFTGPDNDLRRSAVGDDGVSSLRVDCEERHERLRPIPPR